MSLSVLFSNLSHSYPLNIDFSELIESIESLEFSMDVVNFEESGQVVKRLIESVYTDGITGLQNVVVKGQNIEGIFLDQVSPTLTRKFKFSISPTSINYEMLNPDAQNFSESLNFAAKVKAPKTGAQTVADKNGRTRSCTEGKTYPCGKVCRANGKPCRQLLSTEQGAAQKEVVKKSKATGKSTLVEKAEVQPKTTSKAKKAIASLADAIESNSLLAKAVKNSAGIPTKKSSTSVDKNKTLDDRSNSQVKGNTDMNVPTTKIERNDQAQKIVPVKKLNLPERSGEDIDNLAKAQLQSKVQFPVVVQRDGTNFSVLSGQKVAAAAQRAKQLDVHTAESTRVFIANNDDEAKALMYQTQFLNEPSGKGKPPSVVNRKLDSVNVNQLGDAQLVGVKKISSTKEANFDPETVNKLANSMLQVGNIMPIVVQRDSESPLTKFNLVHGELALAAAKRAKEIDPKVGEMTRVFIANDDKEAALLKYQSGTEQISSKKSDTAIDKNKTIGDSGDIGKSKGNKPMLYTSRDGDQKLSVVTNSKGELSITDSSNNTVTLPKGYDKKVADTLKSALETGYDQSEDHFYGNGLDKSDYIQTKIYPKYEYYDEANDTEKKGYLTIMTSESQDKKGNGASVIVDLDTAKKMFNVK